VPRDKAKFVVHRQVPEDHFGAFSEKLLLEKTAEQLFRQYGSCHGFGGKKSVIYQSLQTKESDQYFLDF
jgi:hypothetical protein